MVMTPKPVKAQKPATISDTLTSRIWNSPRSMTPGLDSQLAVWNWSGPQSTAKSSPRALTAAGSTPKSGLYTKVQITPAAASEIVMGSRNTVRKRRPAAGTYQIATDASSDTPVTSRGNSTSQTAVLTTAFQNAALDSVVV